MGGLPGLPPPEGEEENKKVGLPGLPPPEPEEDPSLLDRVQTGASNTLTGLKNLLIPGRKSLSDPYGKSPPGFIENAIEAVQNNPANSDLKRPFQLAANTTAAVGKAASQALPIVGPIAFDALQDLAKKITGSTDPIHTAGDYAEEIGAQGVLPAAGLGLKGLGKLVPSRALKNEASGIQRSSVGIEKPALDKSMKEGVEVSGGKVTSPIEVSFQRTVDDGLLDAGGGNESIFARANTRIKDLSTEVDGLLAQADNAINTSQAPVKINFDSAYNYAKSLDDEVRPTALAEISQWEQRATNNSLMDLVRNKRSLYRNTNYNPATSKESVLTELRKSLAHDYKVAIEKNVDDILGSGNSAAGEIKRLNELESNYYDIIPSLRTAAAKDKSSTLFSSAKENLPLIASAGVAGSGASLLGGGNPIVGAIPAAMLAMISRSPRIQRGVAGGLNLGGNLGAGAAGLPLEGIMGSSIGALPGQLTPMQPIPPSAEVANQNPQAVAMRAGQIAGQQIFQQTGSPEAAQAVAQKTMAETARVFMTGNPAEKEEMLHAQAKMLPGLFQQAPGTYPSELDGKIHSELDGPMLTDATLFGLNSGVVDSITAAKQIQGLNTRKVAPVVYRPGVPTPLPPQRSSRVQLSDSLMVPPGARQPAY